MTFENVPFRTDPPTPEENVAAAIREVVRMARIQPHDTSATTLLAEVADLLNPPEAEPVPYYADGCGRAGHTPEINPICVEPRPRPTRHPNLWEAVEALASRLEADAARLSPGSLTAAVRENVAADLRTMLTTYPNREARP